MTDPNTQTQVASREYRAPEIEDLGTLQELTSAAGQGGGQFDGVGYGPSGTGGS
jgi:hypothetical protein